jgi:hypothetical protein
VALNGDGQAALKAVKTLIARQIEKGAFDAGRNTLAAGVKAGLIAGDYGVVSGAVVGFVNATAGFLHRLAWMAYEYHEVRAANKILAHPEEIDLTIFQVCPLLGCYVLTCSNTSDILNFVLADLGSKDFDKRVARMAHDLESILSRASVLIYHARYELPGAVPLKGQVIRANGINSWMARQKQRVTVGAYNLARHPVKTPREWLAHKAARRKVLQQEAFAWDD